MRIERKEASFPTVVWYVAEGCLFLNTYLCMYMCVFKRGKVEKGFLWKNKMTRL